MRSTRVLTFLTPVRPATLQRLLYMVTTPRRLPDLEAMTGGHSILG